jgi:glyoxylase-like metal-dependent hydrolase (beta-lactamase superfamily II)
MFGSVPKLLWERYHGADEQNRIAMVSRVLVLRGESSCVIVDAGVGDKFGPKETEHFDVRPVPESELPFRWDEVTDIVLTHMHFDHCGGVSVWKEPSGKDFDGPRESRLRVPEARVYLQRENWERARAPGPRERASYLPENVVPLETGRLELVDGVKEVLPGLTVHPSHGHTRGMQWVTVGEGRDTVAFPADLIPTSAHVHLPFVMGYDMSVETVLEEKEAFLRQALDEDWTVVFAHDAKVTAARLAQDRRGRYSLGDPVGL